MDNMKLWLEFFEKMKLLMKIFTKKDLHQDIINFVFVGMSAHSISCLWPWKETANFQNTFCGGRCIWGEFVTNAVFLSSSPACAGFHCAHA